jgi:hypothetical protein
VGKIRDVRQQSAELLEMVMVAGSHRQTLSARRQHRNFDQAIALLQRMVHAEGLIELAGDLARAQRTKQLDLANQAQQPPADALPEVCTTLVQLLRQEGRGGLADQLFTVYQAPGHSLSRKAPSAPFDRYVFHYERLVRGVEEAEIQARQSEALLAKSLAAWGCGDHQGALATAEQALDICVGLARIEERSEHAQRQAAAHGILARHLAGRRDRETAQFHYDQAIALYQQLIEGEGRNDLVVDLTALKESRALLADRGI